MIILILMYMYNFASAVDHFEIKRYKQATKLLYRSLYPMFMLLSKLIIMSPLIEVEIYCFTSHRECDDPMSGYCWPTVYEARPALAQYWATVLCLTPR